MDAGVGAAASGELHRVPHHRGRSLLQGFGHGDFILLHLPAVVGGAHIGEK